MAVTSAPSRWTIDISSLVADLPALDAQPLPSIRRSVPSLDVQGARPLPPLPIELVAAILAFADTATLAAACRVCWDWLREASPVLYERVVIDRHGAFQELFLQRDAPVSLALEPYLSLHQIRHLTLLVQPSTPPSTSRLSLSTSPPPHPLLLESLSVSLAYNGLIGWAPFLSLVRPRAVAFRPCFRRSSKFDFEVEQRSWEVVTSEWLRDGRLARVACIGCNLTCRMRASIDGADGTEDDDEAEHRLVERFIAVPPRPRLTATPAARPPVADADPAPPSPSAEPIVVDAPPLEVTYDLTTLPPLTIPFYRHFLLQRSIDAVFSIPGLRPSADTSVERKPPPPQRRGVRIVVRRQQELEWVTEGLALIRPDERALVTVEVAQAAGYVGQDPSSGGGGGRKGVVGGLGAAVGGGASLIVGSAGSRGASTMVAG